MPAHFVHAGCILCYVQKISNFDSASTHNWTRKRDLLGISAMWLHISSSYTHIWETSGSLCVRGINWKILISNYIIAARTRVYLCAAYSIYYVYAQQHCRLSSDLSPLWQPVSCIQQSSLIDIFHAFHPFVCGLYSRERFLNSPHMPVVAHILWLILMRLFGKNQRDRDRALNGCTICRMDVRSSI